MLIVTKIKREKETLDFTDQILKQPNIQLYPRSTKSFLIVHPHFDNYDEHIKILIGGHYVDLSPKGNRTIGMCKLNRFLHNFGWPDEPSSLEDMLKTAEKLQHNSDPLEQIRILRELAKQLNSNADILII